MEARQVQLPTLTPSADHSPTAVEVYRHERIAHWNAVAQHYSHDGFFRKAYHRRLAEIYRFLIPAGARVLEVGCACGDLLAALRPSYGVGVDFSPEMLRRARERHPDLHFVDADAHELDLHEEFNFIILSDLVNDLWDVQQVLEAVARVARPHTRIILNSYSRLWHLPLAIAEKLGFSVPKLGQNWLSPADVGNLLQLSGLEVVREWTEILLPAPIPLVSRFTNRFLAKLWPFRAAALCNFVIARPQPRPVPVNIGRTVSIIVPARNEAGNIEQIFRRVPDFGVETELVFVEGHSRDGTYEAIEKAMAAHPERPCQLLRQTGEGKGDAVRQGFAHAKGDVLVILDADLTVPPEDLPRFYAALISGKGEFINGVRLVYPMEAEAMRFLNLLGNKFFSWAFSFLLGQPIKDTLCGTKVLWRSCYEAIAANRAYFGDFDPFGDFDLLFGAAKLNQKIVDLPVRYRERRYGTTNIRRWKHGLLLLRMVAFAAGRLKFA
jgi:SAM-dependent methyltransferase